MLMILGYTSEVRSELDGTGQNTLDAIGKKNPFQMVSPIIEAKKNIVQTIVGSQSQSAAALEAIPDLFVETIMLKFLKAANVERVVSNLVSSYGVVAVDKETNSLIVSDGKDNLEKIVTEIRKADQTPKQILVEVVIVDVQLNDETEIGVNWGDYNFGRDDTRHTFSQNLLSSTLSPTTALAGTFTLVQSGLNATVKALQATRDVEILASPRVLVVSGQEALIKTTEEIPYTELTQSVGGGGSTGTAASPITSTKFKEAGISLTVKATLTDEQKILLAIDTSQSINAGVDASLDSPVPIVDKRDAKTNLLMDDGQVLVMGGLRRRETKFTINKVPLLGDLPFVGFLFSSDKTEVLNFELLVFISPHIYRGEQLTDEEMDRFNEMRNTPLLRLPSQRPEFEAVDAVMPSYRE
jgi:type IV pilus assembly protein PilQ